MHMLLVVLITCHAHSDVCHVTLRPRLHYDATPTANTPLKIYYVSSIKTILCLHYNGVVCRSVLTTELYCVYTITEWFAVAY
jgi:hypothetical protein